MIKWQKIQIYQQLNKKHTKQTRTETESWIQSFDGCQMGWGWRRMSEEVRGLRSTSRQLQNRHGDVNYSTGSGIAKELIHMTRGHEQCGDCLRE